MRKTPKEASSLLKFLLNLASVMLGMLVKLVRAVCVDW